MPNQNHWLAGIAIKLGLKNSEKLAIGTKTPVLDAWKEVLTTCVVTEDELVRQVAKHYRLGVADLTAGQPNAIKLLPEKMARRYGIFPLREDDRSLVLASSEPINIEAEQMVAFNAGRRPVFEIASPWRIADAIDDNYSTSSTVDTLTNQLSPELLEAVRVVQEVGREKAVEAAELEAGPVVKLTNLVLRDAIKGGASDIHLEPERDSGIVRFRIDGVLRQFMQMPRAALDRVVSRLKILSHLDISERHRPQDGRARVQVEGKNYDLRLSTIPTREAEKMVLRILDPSKTQRLDDLSISEHELQRFRHLLSFREGIVIVTGPTGSGKTTTLYSGIKELSTGAVNISTVEDPVEYELPGIAQIQVDPVRGVTFASALRALLRQDPDVIFVGEIRDRDTAEIAVQASMTGHLVLATLHTNDAVGAVGRLADLGMDRSAIAETLRGVLSQRLVRRVCANCVETLHGDLNSREQRLAALYGVVPMVRAIGCDKCGNSGYRGRMLVAEVIVATPQLKELISQGAIATELEPVAIEGGMRPIRTVALERVSGGETTLDEIERVLGEVFVESSPQTLKEKASEQTILVVDDDPALRQIAARLLEQNGYRVETAEDGIKALETISGSSKYSLMILDLDMPKLGGRDVLKRLHSSSSVLPFPVVVLTGSVETDAEAAIMDEGADDYIRKPIDPPRFIARVKAAIRRAS